MAFNVTVVEPSSLDAFARTRVSNPINIFDSKQLWDNRSLFWASTTAISGSITYSSNRASTSLNVAASVNSAATRQTKRRFNYITGETLEIINSFVMGASVAGVRKRVGYFDGYNGYYFEDSGGTLSMVQRTNVTGTPVNTAITQASWNIDAFDGSGKSGITLDLSKSQTLFIEFAWLGRVRMGFIIDGKIHYAHQFMNANTDTSANTSDSNLPIRYEIINISGASTSALEQISSSVIVSGEIKQEGVLHSANRGTSTLSVDNAANYPLIGIRLDNNKPGATVTPVSFNILTTTTTTAYKWTLIINPTIGGSDAAVWTPFSSTSAVQYDITRSTSNTLTGGTVIASGYAVGTTTVDLDLNTILTLGLDLSNISDQLVLGVQKVAAGSDTFYAAVTWREFI